MTRHKENTRIVGEYVRARLVLECSVRGRAAQIAKETGFAPIHISRIVRNLRAVGLAFARAMAKLWGLEYEELEKLAYEAHHLPRIPAESAATDLPNLQKTIDWCHHEKVYPPHFLRAYERSVLKEGVRVDRTAREWLFDLEAKFTKHKAERRPRGGRDSRREAPRLSAREEPSGTFARQGATPQGKGAATKSPRAAS